jgi:large subunit ribosomal protein L4
MATIDVFKLTGEKAGSLELAEEVFGVVNENLLWESVNHFRAGQRSGTHSTKTRGLVSGAGRKLWKQKGTGRARVASVRSPLWRHGGTVHGPKPRSYDFQFPRKKLLGALRSALAAKFNDGKMTVVENFELAEVKTKAMEQILAKFEVGKTALLVDEGSVLNDKLELSARNIAGVEVLYGPEVHPYHLLRYERLIISQAALEKLQNSLKASAPKRKAEVA